MTMTEQPIKDKGLDNTLHLLSEGYLFINNRTEEFKSDIFETHLLGQRAICLHGEEAARLFYNPELFARNGAAPKYVQKTLLGMNAIQTMDGEAHIHRKKLFLSLTTAQQATLLCEIVLQKWHNCMEQWQTKDKVVLFDETTQLLCDAVCQWAGVPLSKSELKGRAVDFSAMIDAFGGVGPRHWKGKHARTRTEDWLNGIIKDVRSNKLQVDVHTALYAIASYTELDGKLLNSEMAAIELINLLRPTIAISTYITFGALAIQEHPECSKKLRQGDDRYTEMFVNEVRRYYPFGPFVGTRVKKDFIWNQYEFKQGTLVILDIYGTNHDPRIWEEPEIFYPERFLAPLHSLYAFIPQGGGDSKVTHRCPGEGFVMEIMKVSLDFLVNQVEYEVPAQDLSYSMSRIPTLPQSGFIITNVKRKSNPGFLH